MYSQFSVPSDDPSVTAQAVQFSGFGKVGGKVTTFREEFAIPLENSSDKNILLEPRHQDRVIRNRTFDRTMCDGVLRCCDTVVMVLGSRLGLYGQIESKAGLT